MFVVYVLYSVRDRHFYVGQTAHLRQRVAFHNAGLVRSTKNRRPLKLLCFEVYLTRKEAIHRERYLKTNNARKELRLRLQYSLKLIGDVA
ncbi:GIY-YIG nuclease family protein [Candidatus Woesebacteria bacterium]|nr:GIY-YIG nuclease family protein [Candidatus Woesebacteria bacterium]